MHTQRHRYHFWLIWYWAYAIMICPSCVIGVVCVHLSHKQFWSYKLYILQIYSSIPLVYAHEILSQCDAYFLSGGYLSKYFLFGSPVYMVKLRAFIFSTVMHLYGGNLWGRNYISIDSILKSYEFLKVFTFCTFLLIGKYTKDTKFISGTPHTDTCIYTDTCIHRQIPILILLI